ncbi:MAG: septum formation initiator family protein [Clostridia bacterium]|nr:septum formation initiator family protein [Clostridia bacterium]
MNKRKKSKIGLLIVIGLTVYFGYEAFNQQIVLNSKRNELDNIQKKIADEEKLNKDLTKQKDIMNSDEYIEKVAREKLGMVKSGEKVFVDVNQ